LAGTGEKLTPASAPCPGAVPRAMPVTQLGIIVQADDVVLAEVVTVLELNEHEDIAAAVLNPVSAVIA
jgi:hypothetical protein